MTVQPLSFLIVEDEAVLAMDLAMMIEDCGHQVGGEAASVAQVEDLSPDLPIDIAFVDVQLLGGSSGVDAARWLRGGWPDIAIIFVTANPRKLPDDLAGAIGYISKPFTRAGMMQAIDYLSATVRGRLTAVQPPSCFVPSPALPVQA